ncbi:MAG: hypothetical protein SO016_11280 [Lachnospiraceae bacterium]|nr:hypothetical protein [Robinsoniella sp.]MDY3767247.1 hypothetical protein [Lachnospiraceae bacterium]
MDKNRRNYGDSLVNIFSVERSSQESRGFSHERFKLKEDVGRDYAKKLVEEEVKRYKSGLDKSGTKYKILSEEIQPDGSVMIEIKKQYNTSPVGSYLD